MGLVLSEHPLSAGTSTWSWISMSKKQKQESPRVFLDNAEVSPRLLTTSRIICGDCAGDGPYTIKTLLTVAGKCSQCGGGSYILASRITWSD
jgi:hypothetical protein